MLNIVSAVLWILSSMASSDDSVVDVIDKSFKCGPIKRSAKGAPQTSFFTVRVSLETREQMWHWAMEKQHLISFFGHFTVLDGADASRIAQECIPILLNRGFQDGLKRKTLV